MRGSRLLEIDRDEPIHRFGEIWIKKLDPCVVLPRIKTQNQQAMYYIWNIHMKKVCHIGVFWKSIVTFFLVKRNPIHSNRRNKTIRREPKPRTRSRTPKNNQTTRKTETNQIKEHTKATKLDANNITAYKITGSHENLGHLV